MPPQALLLQVVVDGLLLGAFYAIVAVGLTLVFGVMRIVNFAHGDFVMVGMYLSLLCAHGLGLDPYPAMLLVLPGVTLLAALVYRVLIQPILNDPEHNQVLVTLGLSLILQNVALMVFSADLQHVPSQWSAATFRLGDVIVRTPMAIGFVLSVALCLGLYALLKRTELGWRIRATALDRHAALLCGISVERMYLLAFCLGVGSLGVVAPLLAPLYYVAPTIGVNFTLTAFVVVVLGSMGNFLGALVGGLVIGLVESLGALLTGGSVPYLLTYTAFVLILLVRPTGLFGGPRL
jgi:branched-chain amino acid transport system permease protein